MLPYLENNLKSSLENAKSICVAVALIKDYGLNILEGNLPNECIRKYLVGIDLPTPPNVLRKLLKLKETNPGLIDSKIYKSLENFHPKVYLIELDSGRWIAFLGSANATRGGLNNNIEMNVEITNQDTCNQIKLWFNDLFKIGIAFDEDYINNYEKVFTRNNMFASAQQSNIDQFLNKINPAPGKGLIVSPNQFFQQHHFDAYSDDNQLKDDFNVNIDRSLVRDRLLELHDLIYPQFHKYGLVDLFCAFQRNFYTSQYFHSRGHNHIRKESIWLHYGKSPTQLKAYPKGQHTITQHERLQVILVNSEKEALIGVWLYIGKEYSSLPDRQALKSRLEDQIFVEALHAQLKFLGDSYWIWIEDMGEIGLASLESPADTKNFLLKDDYSGEFIIGRNYPPNHPSISIEKIEETILNDFSRLYNVYQMIKA